MTTSKPRVRAYVDHDTYAKLQFATSRPHVTISDTVNNALKVYLSDDYKIEHDNAVLRRLDQMTQQMERSGQKANVHAEAFAMFARVMFRFVPILPDSEAKAAITRGAELFEQFTVNLKATLMRSPNLFFGALEDVYLDESAFFTEVELEALRQVAVDETSHGTSQEEWPEDTNGV